METDGPPSTHQPGTTPLSLHPSTSPTHSQYDEAEDAALGDAYAAALAAGLNLFDSGDSYGTGRLSGRSESLLGQFRAEGRGARAPLPVAVATKIAPYPWRLTSGQWLAAARASAERAGGLALAQLHWSTSTYAPWQVNERMER